jgi:peroxiredoxin
LLARKADHSKFQALNVQVLGISANTRFSQKVHADSLQLPYPLLSDYPDMKTIDDYGVRHRNRPKTTVAKRHFFLIDTQGIVRGKWQGEDLEVFPSEILLKAGRDIVAER